MRILYSSRLLLFLVLFAQSIYGSDEELKTAVDEIIQEVEMQLSGQVQPKGESQSINTKALQALGAMGNSGLQLGNSGLNMTSLFVAKSIVGYPVSAIRKAANQAFPEDSTCGNVSEFVVGVFLSGVQNYGVEQAVGSLDAKSKALLVSVAAAAAGGANCAILLKANNELQESVNELEQRERLIKERYFKILISNQLSEEDVELSKLLLAQDTPFLAKDQSQSTDQYLGVEIPQLIQMPSITIPFWRELNLISQMKSLSDIRPLMTDKDVWLGITAGGLSCAIGHFIPEAVKATHGRFTDSSNRVAAAVASHTAGVAMSGVQTFGVNRIAFALATNKPKAMMATNVVPVVVVGYNVVTQILGWVIGCF